MRIFGFPPFEDRRDAGRRLAGKLLRFKDEQTVVFALPRGGVPVGYEISRALEAPLDVFVSRKLGAPDQPEFGIGAVATGGGTEATLLQGREARAGSGGADRDPGRRRARYRSDGPRRRTSPAIAETETSRPGSASMRRPDRGSLQDRGGRVGLPGVSFGPRGHRLLVQELRADLGRGGRRTARKSQERTRRRRESVEASRAASTGRWETGPRTVQLL
jgi:hypothetical protein